MRGRGKISTLCFSNIHAELVALFEHSPSSLLNEVVESGCELVHTAAQVVEAEIDCRELVRHGRRIVR